MAFSRETTDAAWNRAGGKCECTRKICTHHTARCNAPLSAGKWHAHHKTAVASGGDDSLSNCEGLCIPCHKNTQTYGG
jgi:5-methylcytosine-specific restriction protein A